MIDYKTIPPEIIKAAEKAAYDWHYPDSAAKGIRDKKTGFYIDEAETTIQIWLEGYLYGRQATEAKPLL